MNPGLELVMTLRVEIAPSLEWNTVREAERCLSHCNAESGRFVLSGNFPSFCVVTPN